MPGFRHCQQCSGVSGFEQNIWLQPRETADGVEVSAQYEIGIQEKQRMAREPRHLDRRGIPKRQSRMAGGKDVQGFEWMAREAPVVWLDRVHENLSEVDLAAFQHPQHLGTKRVDQFYLYVGITPCVDVQKIRKHAFDVPRRSCIGILTQSLFVLDRGKQQQLASEQHRSLGAKRQRIS